MPVAPQSYNSIIPQAADLLNQSQPQLLNNFGALSSWIDQNHVDSQVAGNQPGKHTFVQLPVQTGSPNGGFLAGEGALFTQTSAVTGNPELVYARGTFTPYEITTYGTGTFTFNDPNYGIASYRYIWTRLPSGLIQIRATSTSTSFNIPNAGITIPYPTGGNFPGFGTAVYSINAAYQDSRTNPGGNNNPLTVVYQITPSLTQFQVGIATQWHTGTTFFTFDALGI